jgi:hypothetical protein
MSQKLPGVLASCTQWLLYTEGSILLYFAVGLARQLVLLNYRLPYKTSRTKTAVLLFG